MYHLIMNTNNELYLNRINDFLIISIQSNLTITSCIVTHVSLINKPLKVTLIILVICFKQIVNVDFSVLSVLHFQP